MTILVAGQIPGLTAVVGEGPVEGMILVVGLATMRTVTGLT